jgi:carbamate kinase
MTNAADLDGTLGVDARPLAVVALGGNALLPAGGQLTMAVQREQALKAAVALAPLAVSHRLVITHGSGPQVGILSEQSLQATALKDSTLDVVDAEIEGMIGYVLMQAFRNTFACDVATILTQVVVNPYDDAFSVPTKPIGGFVSEETAKQLRGERGWTFIKKPDGFRRIVASPVPLEIVELPSIRALRNAGVVPICAGGGGIPVVRTDYQLGGIEAVVDKDHVSSLLAQELKADVLVLLTDVDGLSTGFGNPHAQLVRHAPVEWARHLNLEAGSIAPKVQACCSFVDATGNPAFIGKLSEAAEVVAGTKGTRFDAVGTTADLECQPCLPTY